MGCTLRYGPDPWDSAVDDNAFDMDDPDGQSLFGDALGDPYVDVRAATWVFIRTLKPKATGSE